MGEDGTSRRDFLRMGVTGISAAAATALGFEVSARQQQENQQNPEQLRHQEFLDSVKNLTYEDVLDPEGAKFQSFFYNSAREYTELVGMDSSSVENIIAKTHFYKTDAEYNSASYARGSGPNFEISFGRNFTLSGETIINLQDLRVSVQDATDFPGAMIFQVLVHEWQEATNIPRNTGEYLNSMKEASYDSNNQPHRWTSYDEMQIVDDSGGKGLDWFSNAVNQLVTHRLVSETFKEDEMLRNAAINILPIVWYFEQARAFSRIAEAAELTTSELVQMFKTSDVEGLFRKMGSVYAASAIQEFPLESQQRGGRTDAEMLAEKDFMVGKRCAFLIQTKNWDALKSMNSHLLPREQRPPRSEVVIT